MSAWTDLVSEMYKKNSGKGKDYKLKDAMRDAKKVYKKPAEGDVVKTKKSRKSSKKSKKSKTRRTRRKH